MQRLPCCQSRKSQGRLSTFPPDRPPPQHSYSQSQPKGSQGTCSSSVESQGPGPLLLTNTLEHLQCLSLRLFF